MKITAEQLNDLTARLKQQGFRVNRMTKDDLRIYLKNKGWHRSDFGNTEYWNLTGVTKSPLGVSLKTAVKNQLKIDGYS